VRSNGGIIGGKKTSSTSVASGIWAIRDQQREKGASNWPGPIIVDYLVIAGGGVAVVLVVAVVLAVCVQPLQQLVVVVL